MVAFDTKFGRFVVQLFEKKAPISTANLLRRIEVGLFANSTIYRIVTLANQLDTVPAKIQVVQFGFPSLDGRAGDLPPIAHETTEVTGLRHVDGTLAMARLAPGSAGSAFFICIGDQPELDYGGRRNPDGQGFAAFGQVIEGMDVVRTVFALGEERQQVSNPIPIDALRL
jgi:peptidyl-prolyl cis-trans isomerase A (cyclophilin A)